MSNGWGVPDECLFPIKWRKRMDAEYAACDCDHEGDPCHRACRYTLKRMYRKARIKRDRETQVTLDTVLSDADLSCVVCCEMCSLHAKCCVGFTGHEEGDLQSLLEWLLDHADEILALIQKIIDMFTKFEEV